ncbi:YCF48-related protein [Winogradskyella sp. 3972H.M.0a.05]|uniref:YCF48-related protein n=1 Tax=Winogradskyella sp. 3972H.M.0a.05 TaxID=2950277 RepID=UPI0033917787
MLALQSPRPFILGKLIVLITFLSTFNGYSQSWQTLNANTFSWRFEDMHFVDPDIGWVVDGGGQILKTTNGGQNWTQQFYDSDLYFRSVEFYNDQVGVAGTLANGNPTAQLLRTTDGGQNWEDITSNFPANVLGICGISFASENTIFITGVFYGQAYIMKSTDQGDNWTYQSMASLANGLVDVYFKDENNGWAVGQSAQGTGLRAVILGTTNGGANWNVLATANHNNQRAWKIQQLNDDVFYVSIEEFEPSPQYYKSTDGGQNWNLENVVTTNTSGTMQGIGFLTEDIGWIGGFNQLFYETLDGGQTWEYKPSVGSSFNRFQRVNDTLMYSSGTNVYRYADASLSIEEFEINQPKGHTITIDGKVPVEGNTDIMVNLVNNTFAELSVYDINGKRVQTISRGMKSSGDHHISWETSSLTPGAYFLVLYTYHGYESIKVIVR